MRGGLLSRPEAAALVQGLFPPGGPLGAAGPLPPISPELREELKTAVCRAIQRFPRRSSLGPNGSRFEHWGLLKADSEALGLAAEDMVGFLLGECPPGALHANLWARLTALVKTGGGVRPLAAGSVLRRLAAKGACAVFKDAFSGAVGPQQFGVGRSAGTELVHKSITALTDEDPSRIVIAFDAANAYGNIPRDRILEGVSSRVPELAGTAWAWLGAGTTHWLWDEGGRAHPVRATKGVDQGCPLSPVFFALGLASSLQEIARRLRDLDRQAHVFAYLDDIIVVVPSRVSGQAAAVVAEVLANAGLTLNAGKTKVWSKDKGEPVPAELSSHRVDRLGVLGAGVASLDREEGELEAPVHGVSGGEEVLVKARALVRRLRELRSAGLSARAAFLVLHTYAGSCINHLQRANYEDGAWVAQLKAVLFEGLGDLIGQGLGSRCQEIASLKFTAGGLAFGGVVERSAQAFLASWALTLKEVAGTLGVASEAGFRARCPSVAQELAKAEEELLRQGATKGERLDWGAFLAEPAPHLQRVWALEAGTCKRDRLLAGMGPEDATDLRSQGGVGAGGFLQPYLGEERQCQVLPDAHFQLLLRDRLLLPVCPAGGSCQHRRSDGRVCGEPLDPRGWHARKCAIGGGLDKRHNAIRDWAASTYTASTGLATSLEQHVPQWDRTTIDDETGQLRVEQAILDVATADARSGQPKWFDITVKCAHTDDLARLGARSRRDGRAAADAAAGKRRRYSEAGPALLPLAFESGGRPAEDTIAFIRQCGSSFASGGRDGSQQAQLLWQECSTLLQRGNAELILSAIGK